MRWTLILGAMLAGLALLLAALSFVWTPYDITQMDVANKLQGPSAAHWLGTDHFGRDILSMVMLGARTSIAVALVAVGIGIAIGVPLGGWRLDAAGRRKTATALLAVVAVPAIAYALFVLLIGITQPRWN